MFVTEARGTCRTSRNVGTVTRRESIMQNQNANLYVFLFVFFIYGIHQQDSFTGPAFSIAIFTHIHYTGHDLDI